MSYSAMDRFTHAFEGKLFDRVPIFPMTSSWVPANFSRASLEETVKDPDILVEAQLKARDAVGYDCFFAYAEALHVAEAFGCSMRYTDTGPLATSLPIEIKTLEDVDKFRCPNPSSSGRFPEIQEVIRKLHDYGKGDIPLLGLVEGPFTAACRIFEAQMIMRMTMKNRVVLEALLDKINDFLIEYGRTLIKNGANVIFLPDPSSSCSMIAPRLYREIVLPRVQRLTKNLSVPCMLHICGDTSLILELMNESGAEVLSLDQCMDMPEARRVLPGAVIGGNIDPINALLMGTREKVVEDTLACLRTTGIEKFVLMSGCGVPPKAPVENVKAMVDTACEYRLG